MKILVFSPVSGAPFAFSMAFARRKTALSGMSDRNKAVEHDKHAALQKSVRQPCDECGTMVRFTIDAKR